MDSHRTVHCVFYSHVWCIHLIDQAGLGELDNAVLIELANESHLAPVFSRQKNTRYGLPGLLVLPDQLEKLATQFRNLPAPLVLAANPKTTTVALESAAALLATVDNAYDKAVLLVHVNDAAEFINTYDYMDSFSILWDLADLPNRCLQNLTEVLANNHCLTDERWDGLHLCQHPRRPLIDADQRYTVWQNTLAEYPGIAIAA